MSPKAILAAVLAFSCLTVTSGCRKPPPVKTSADLPVPVDTTTTTVPEIAAPQAPAQEPDVIERDPLDGELGQINEYLRRQGFLTDTYFDYDQSGLSTEARERLARSAQFLRERPQFVLTLEGHCDERGTSEYNLSLGERRAQSTKDYLVSLGIPDSRLNTISYGEERPVCQDAEESCWWQNRRAHPMVTGRNVR